MTETLKDMNATSQTNTTVDEVRSPESVAIESAELEISPSAAELDIARQLVRSARARGMALTGPGGMLKALTKTVIETALDEEMVHHLGYDKHQPEGRGSGNLRNGTRSKTVTTGACGPVEIEVPRDRDGSFAPVVDGARKLVGFGA